MRRTWRRWWLGLKNIQRTHHQEKSVLSIIQVETSLFLSLLLSNVLESEII